jgi:hypothetical protein
MGTRILDVSPVHLCTLSPFRSVSYLNPRPRSFKLT